MIRTNLTDWDQELATFSRPSLLQTSAWAHVKEQYGWTSIPVKWLDPDQNTVAMALVLKRQFQVRGLKLPISMLYIPKGPILDWENKGLVDLVLEDLRTFGKEEKAFLVKIEPEIRQFVIANAKEPEKLPLNPMVTPTFLSNRNWTFSDNQIQFRNSVFIDLKLSEDELLAQMKQKTRYNIRLSSRKGVTVREGTEKDFESIYKLYAETSLRDGFVIRSKDYYLTVWETFLNNNQLTPLIAYYEDEPLAALMLFHFQETAYYIYGMSTNRHRNLMPTYLLQWEAIKKAKALGCATYDLWGAPNTLSEEDSMWGVYRFKIGLGGTTIGTIGAWDTILQPLTHKIYSNVLPKVLSILRRKGTASTAESV